MSKKLLYITGDSNQNIDECLMIVPDNFDKEDVLAIAEEGGIVSPSIANIINIDFSAFGEIAADYRPYIG